jgi:hypothetical protein
MLVDEKFPLLNSIKIARNILWYPQSQIPTIVIYSFLSVMYTIELS